MYDDGMLVPMFDMEFYETMCVPTSSEYIADSKVNKRMYRSTCTDTYEYASLAEDATHDPDATPYVTTINGYVKDSRTAQDASYIPDQKIWDLATWNTINKSTGVDWSEFKVQHILIIGKDALTRTGLAGEDQTRVYVKEKGSAGVLDPIDQRQSIGFKINSVGFGSTRLEACVDYVCVPSQVNDQ